MTESARLPFKHLLVPMRTHPRPSPTRSPHTLARRPWKLDASSREMRRDGHGRRACGSAGSRVLRARARVRGRVCSCLCLRLRLQEAGRALSPATLPPHGARGPATASPRLASRCFAGPGCTRACVRARGDRRGSLTARLRSRSRARACRRRRRRRRCSALAVAASSR